jgi:hypothetical protein
MADKKRVYMDPFRPDTFVTYSGIPKSTVYEPKKTIKS